MSLIHPFNFDDITMYSPQFDPSMPNTVDDEHKSKKSRPPRRSLKKDVKRGRLKTTKKSCAFCGPLMKKLYCAKIGRKRMQRTFLPSCTVDTGSTIERRAPREPYVRTGLIASLPSHLSYDQMRSKIKMRK
ncbi:hypothetical protein Tco_0982597, partial [Tanacetum coccineum]